MAKVETVEKKDQKVEKSSKKNNKSSYSKKKKIKKNILNGGKAIAIAGKKLTPTKK